MFKRVIFILIISSCVIIPYSFGINWNNFQLKAETVIGSGAISQDTIWTLANSPYIVGNDYVSGELYIPENTILTIEPGVVIKFKDNASIFVEGELIANGTADNPIIFTSIKDNIIEDNCPDCSLPGAGDWQAIYLIEEGRIEFDYTFIRYGGGKHILMEKNNHNFFVSNQVYANDYDESVGALGFKDKGQAIINNSSITNNIIGIEVFEFWESEEDGLKINNSEIVNNIEFGIMNYSENEVEADSCWWGHESGPAHEDNPGGQGEAIVGNINFEAWLSEPVFSDEPEIDPLILKYEPILYLHPDEDFFPMNVEAFVENSSLWDSMGAADDELIKSESDTDPVVLEDLAGGVELGDWYLQFSENLADKMPDPAKARTEYQGLANSNEAKTAYYAYKIEDSYIDDFGVEHEFIVLEYWYFYAFNNWKEHGGFNNHEGDWECVMVFLDKDSEQPLYVAYSSHHNAGTKVIPVYHHTSVRRNWESNEIVKQGNQVASFVALGSHANYPNNGENGIHNAFSFIYNDRTSTIGEHINTWNKKNILNSNLQWLSDYEGGWGLNVEDITEPGSSGPQGPYYREDSNMFLNPVAWAGVDNIQRRIITEPLTSIEFSTAQAVFDFEESLPKGTVLEVDLHDETFAFFSNIEEYTFLPYFWDFELSLPEDSFKATVTLNYDPFEADNLGIAEEDITVLFFNEEENAWEIVPTQIDIANSTATFITSHFSRYALGTLNWKNISDGLRAYKTMEFYNPSTGVRQVSIRLKNISNENINGDLRLLVDDISKEGVELLNFTGITSDNISFIDINNPYKQCVFMGSEEQLNALPFWLKRIFEKSKPVHRAICDQAIKKFPEFEEYIEYLLAPNRFSQAIKLKFRLPDNKIIHTRKGDIHIPEFLKFDFGVEVLNKMY